MGDVYDDITYYLWLANIEGIGNRTAYGLLESLGHPKTIWDMTYHDLVSEGVPRTTANNICDSKDLGKVKTLQDKLIHNGIGVTTIGDSDYPEYLSYIYDPPVILYTKGRLPKRDSLFISVVGTRTCSAYGNAAAYHFAKGLTERGAVIVSGMALGIDTSAHKGALAAGGETVAVLGSGLDVCYPPQNADLMDKIARHGCVVSEYPPGVRPYRHNFPRRNRIISGLSRGLVVIEAGERSGTQITVECALEQGREVFAVPGNLSSSKSVGTNSLIKQGAVLVTTVDDIFNEIDSYKKKTAGSNGKIEDKTHKKSVDKKAEDIYNSNDGGKSKNESIISENDNIMYNSSVMSDMDDAELLVYGAVSELPVQMEDIVAKTGISPSSVIYILSCFEMDGIVDKLAGNRYVRL